MLTRSTIAVSQHRCAGIGFVEGDTPCRTLSTNSVALRPGAHGSLPNWLDRLLPTIDIEGDTGLPDNEIVVVHEPQAADDREPVLV